MAYNLKNTTGLVNTRITDTGRLKLSQGNFGISYFQIGDSEVTYNVLPDSYTQSTTNILEPNYNSQNSVGVPQSNKQDIKYPFFVDGTNGSTYGIPFMDSQVYGVFNSAAVSNLNINQNIIRNITRTGNTGGLSIGIYTSSIAALNSTISQNTIDTLTVNGTGTGGSIYGIQASGVTFTLENNSINYLRILKSTGTGALYGIASQSGSTNEYHRYNNIYNLSHSGTGIVYGLYVSSSGNKFISYNNFYTISTAGTVSAIAIASGVVNIFNNKIYDITTNTALTTAIASNGITIGSLTSGATHFIYNNLISRIYAPAANGGTNVNVFGLNITNATTNTNIKVYNNTINIDATSTGTNFSTTTISSQYSATSTSGNIELRNNIFVNTSIPRGTGIVSVLRRAALASLVNLNTNSDRNLFFTGATITNRCLFYDGTSQINNIGSLQTTLSPREANSISEDPNFLSNIGNNSNYLKINPSISTNIESGGRNVSPVSFDFANVVRAGNNGYTTRSVKSSTEPASDCSTKYG
jgi:hypothetical protein